MLGDGGILVGGKTYPKPQRLLRGMAPSLAAWGIPGGLPQHGKIPCAELGGYILSEGAARFLFSPDALFCNTLPGVFGEPSGVLLPCSRAAPGGSSALPGAIAGGFTPGIGPGAQGWARADPWELQPRSIP